MIIGKIDFDKPKRKVPRWNIDFYNFKNCLYDYYFERRHIILTCRFCGQLLAPCVEHIGPKEAGFERLGKHWWLCHQCVYHGGPWYGTGVDRREFKENVRKHNAEIKRLLIRYSLNHPWVHYKKL